MALLNNYKKTEVKIEKIEKIKSQFDYSEFSEEEAIQLIELEEKAIHTGSLLSENLREFADIFNQAQGIFANNKNGNFGKWYESLGFKKDFVYLCLDRKNLAIKYEQNIVYALPDRTVKDIKKLDKQNETEIVYEILEAEKPSEKLKEIKKEVKQKEDIVAEKDPMHIQYEQERIAKKEILDRIYLVEKLVSKSDVKNKKSQIVELLEKIEDILQI